MNLIIATGRLTKDNELKYTSNQKEVVKNTIAVRRDKDNSDFISFTAFGNTAKILNEYTSKGSLIGIRGEIRTGSYEKDGQKHFTQDVIVNQLELLDSKKTSTEQPKEETKVESDPYKEFGNTIDESDFPF